MRKLFSGLAILPFLGSAAFAAQPLTDQQMDKVSAGGAYFGGVSYGPVCKPPTPVVPPGQVPTIPIPELSPEGK